MSYHRKENDGLLEKGNGGTADSTSALPWHQLLDLDLMVIAQAASSRMKYFLTILSGKLCLSLSGNLSGL